jgi:hypothetical protein
MLYTYVSLKCKGEFLEGLKRVKSKASTVTGHGFPKGCEMSRLPHFLDNGPRDGGEVFRLMCWPPFYLEEDFWYSCLLEAELILGAHCVWKD